MKSNIKKINYVVVVLFLFLVTFAGCKYGDLSKQQAYEMGVEHSFGDVTVRLSQDEENERFVLECKISEKSDEVRLFSFELNISATESLNNCEQFDYGDNLGSQIVFGENGYYEFYSDRIFYISYKNADENVKKIILDKKYISISTLSKTFYR